MDLGLANELLVAVIPPMLLAWVALVRGRRWEKRHIDQHHGERLHSA